MMVVALACLLLTSGCSEAEGPPGRRVTSHVEATSAPSGQEVADSVEEATARRDLAVLRRRGLDDPDGVRMSALGECAGSPVIQIGVSDPSVPTPRRGPGGTPVLRYFQLPISALA